jgi:hypothetical protein
MIIDLILKGIVMVKKIVMYLTILSGLCSKIDLLSLENAAAKLVYDKRLAEKAAATFDKKVLEVPNEIADPVTLNSYSELLEKENRASFPILACVEKNSLGKEDVFYFYEASSLDRLFHDAIKKAEFEGISNPATKSKIESVVYLKYDPALEVMRPFGYGNQFETKPLDIHATFFSKVGADSRMEVYKKMRTYFNKNHLNEVAMDVALVVIKLYEREPASVPPQLLNLARYDYARLLSGEEYQPADKRARVKELFRDVITYATQHPRNIDPILVNAARDLLSRELAKDAKPEDRAEIRTLLEAIVNAPKNERTEAMLKYAQNALSRMN